MEEKTEALTVCVQKGGQADAARSLAGKTGAQLSDRPGEGLSVIYDASGVTLSGYGLSYRGDFEEMLHRVTNGRTQHEMLVHIAKTKKPSPRAVDATAGMGEDSLLLAAAGYEVTMFERNAVVAALLKDAMRRAKKHPVLKEIVPRMRLIEGDSTALMDTLPFTPELVYLDPMFPERQKTGLVNKRLQLIQKLEQPCCAEKELLDAAMRLSPERIIIKRPLKGELLAGKEVDYSVKGKAIRYDCIVLKK